MEKSETYKRLPTDVVPVNYSLTLEPHFNPFCFLGKNQIDVQVKSETDSIQLNSLDLQIVKAMYKNSEGHESVPTIQYDIPNEIVTLKFEQVLSIGVGCLYLEFKGALNSSKKGFYYCKEKNEDGSERYSAVTKFEAINARRCFPCWDEPDIKATFDVSVVACPTTDNFVVISNMPIKNVHNQTKGWKQYNFERSPKMSTYLVAVVVGEYEYVEGKSDEGVLVRVYTPLGKRNQGMFSLKVATKALSFFKEYFNIEYPLPKMDLIAVPEFLSGAMENWGLITFRDKCLLVDENRTPEATKQQVAVVVSHEIAHQWFGNLVTMKWWTHLWLNEGYATFAEFLCVDHVLPEYQIWDQFIIQSFLSALAADSLESSHPIEVTVHNPKEVQEVFDTISYEKGASIIRMLHDLISDEKFRKGMHLYLKRLEYQNAATEDLWQALSEVSDIDVGQVMSTWTTQMGYPIVSVARRQSETNANDTILTVHQEKYATVDNQTGQSQLWMIPLSIQVLGSTPKIIKKIVSERDTEILLKDCSSQDDAVLLNPGMVGFYRTKYSPEMLKTLLQRDELKPVDRMSLVTDSYAMINAKKGTVCEFLQLVKSYRSENDFNVWSLLYATLKSLGSILQYKGFDVEQSFNQFQLNFVSEIGSKIEWESKKDETHMEIFLRTLILRYLVELGDEKTVARAIELFEKSKICGESTTAALPANLLSICYQAIMRKCSPGVFRSILETYSNSDSADERNSIVAGFSCLSSVDLIHEVLRFSLSDNVLVQDSVHLIVSVSKSSIQGRDLAWAFIKSNWDELMQRYDQSFLISRLLMEVPAKFANEQSFDDVKSFFNSKETASIRRTVQKVYEQIQLRIRLLDLNAVDEIMATLMANGH